MNKWQMNPLKPKKVENTNHLVKHLRNSVLYWSVFACFLQIKTNSEYFPVQRLFTGIYNRDSECLQQGTSCVFNLLKTKRNPLYIRNQTVPRSKLLPPRL